MSEVPGRSDLAEALGTLRNAFDVVAKKIPEPIRIVESGETSWAHAQFDSDLFLRLKAARVMSGLNGALLLLSAGLGQEVAVLLRVVQDCLDDILFSVGAERTESMTSQHEAMFRAFFEYRLPTVEEVRSGKVSKDPFVPRRKITAAVARLLKVPDPSTFLSVHAAESAGLDGYVHPAYPPIMELYNPETGQFEVDGDLRSGALRPILIYFADTVRLSLAVFGVIAARDGERDLMATLLQASERLRS